MPRTNAAKNENASDNGAAQANTTPTDENANTKTGDTPENTQPPQQENASDDTNDARSTNTANAAARGAGEIEASISAGLRSAGLNNAEIARVLEELADGRGGVVDAVRARHAFTTPDGVEVPSGALIGLFVNLSGFPTIQLASTIHGGRTHIGPTKAHPTPA